MAVCKTLWLARLLAAVLPATGRDAALRLRTEPELLGYGIESRGDWAEPVAWLEQVQSTFAAEDLPYDAALSGLDLAVLWLEERRSQEVQELAKGMHWIFRHQRIEREALAALKLFCDAAKQEVATVELALQVSAEIEKVRHSASRLDDTPGGRD